jgi:hypothetical protein
MKAVLKKVSRITTIIVAAGFIAGLLAACTPGGGSSSGGGAAPVELGNYENAIKVTPTLDTERAVTETIGFAGGTISATAADGTVFTLTIPAQSVRQRTQITMTPVSKLDGLPFGNGTDVTVDLQPSGLVFDVPATLSIEPATPIPAGEQILYGYSEDRLVFAEPVLKADGIAIVVPHFSGYGATKGFMGDVEEVRKRIGGSAEERIASEMRAVMQAAHQAEKRGEPPPRFGYPLQPYFEQYEREVIEPRLAAAGQSCAAGRSAMITVLGYSRMRALLGYEDDNVMPQVADLLENTVAPKCMDEEYAMCVNEHIVHRIAVAYLGIDRQLALLGIENSPVLAKMKQQVNNCLHFDLEFKVDTRFELDTRSINQSYMSYAESTELFTELVFDMDKTLGNQGASYFEPSSGPMESLKQVYRQTAPGCVPGTVSSWSDTGHFLAMDLGIDSGDTDKGGGGVTSIEVELGLPSPQVIISGMSCGGVTAPPAADLAGAPALYLLNQDDGFIRDWKIQGNKSPAGQAFVTAIADWSIMNAPAPTASFEDKGTATLRHTPR